MSKWHSRISMLTDLRIIDHGENEQQWINFDTFVKLLQTNSQKEDKVKVRKDLIVKEVDKYQQGFMIIDNERYISVQAILRYSFHHCDQLISCKRIISQVISVTVIQTGDYNILSQKEVYSAIAETQFHKTLLEQFVNRIAIPQNSSIPTLVTEYQRDFSEVEWKRICIFEWHFSRTVKWSNYAYAELVNAKWNFLDSIKKAKDISKVIQGFTPTAICQHSERKDKAQIENSVYLQGSKGIVHNPERLEQDLIVHLQDVEISGISRVICIDCAPTCNHQVGIHVVLETQEHESSKEEDITSLIKTFLLSKHDTACSHVSYCAAGSLANSYFASNLPMRFHIRDAIAQRKIQPVTIHVTENEYDFDPSSGFVRCDSCYPAHNIQSLSFKSFNTEQEWLFYVPLPVQLLLESFINPRAVLSDDNNPFLAKKLHKLYFIYDLLLNIFNKKHIGILQERNTYDLIMGCRSVTNVFNIAAAYGSTMALKVAEVKLKARSDIDLCYFNTYVKHHELEYFTQGGKTVRLVRISDCPVKCLLVDNLVRLRYHSDPKPGEHRSQQICTMPITIKGIPADEEQLTSWHRSECAQATGNCPCKQDHEFSARDVSVPLTLNANEQKSLEKFNVLSMWGHQSIWIPLKNGACNTAITPAGQNIASGSQYFSESAFAAEAWSSDSDESMHFPDDGDFDISLASLNIVSDSENESDVLSDSTDTGEHVTDEIEDSHTDPALLEENMDSPFSLLQSLPDVPVSDHDPDLHSFLSHLDHEQSQSKKQLSALADVLHDLSMSHEQLQESPRNHNATEDALKFLELKQFHPPSQLVRHPPPATGRDDDIDKLKEVLDEVILQSGHDGEKGDRIIFAPDHKIGANLLRLKSKNPKYASIVPEFPVLHLRKSKITNLCSAYKDAGILHLLMYMRDADDQDWAKLISSTHIDKATKYIHRLALALHLAFMLSFITTLPSEQQKTLLNHLSNGSLQHGYHEQFNAFIETGKTNNAVFALHHDMMTHCSEVGGIAFAERLGGPEGYNLLLAIVKQALPFAFVNGSSSYALFATQLMHEHHKCGTFSRNMKSSLFTSPHKSSEINFALDSQREMDHQDVTRSFRSGSSLASIVPKMANVDFLVQELQPLVKQQDAHEESTTEKKTLNRCLGLDVSATDLVYIYRAAALIMRRGGVSHGASQRLKNIYDENPHSLVSTSILDRESLDVGRFLINRCLVKFKLFGASKDNTPHITDFQGTPALKHKAAVTKGITIKRTAIKPGKESKSQWVVEEEKRRQKVNREKKTVEHLGSRMNACQAVVGTDCQKSALAKADRVKKAAIYVIVEAFRTVHSMPACSDMSDVIKTLNNECLFVDGTGSAACHKISGEIGAITYEFAGMKFRGHHETGSDYICHVEAVIQRTVQQFPNAHHIAVCEEKYSFTPDLFKGPTRQLRSNRTQHQSISIQHLKKKDEIISEQHFSKKAITQTKSGKETISTYLAKNVSNINTKRPVIIDIDSEFEISPCTCKLEICKCERHAVPLRCTFVEQGTYVSSQRLNVKQRKGEAELAQIDWLMEYQTLLKPGESCLSIVSSGDVDAVIAHLFAVSHMWPRQTNGDFHHQVYVLLLKPSSQDLYNITGMIQLFEKAYADSNAGIRMAIYLCLGGNDFLPKYHNISHKDIVQKILTMDKLKDNLLEINFDGKYPVQVDQEVYLELIKALYCPKYLLPEAFTYAEVRQMSVQVPCKNKAKTSFRDPKLWMPPSTAVQRICELVQFQIDYLLTAGAHSANYPDVTSCFTISNQEATYNFGPDVHVTSPTDILLVPQSVLANKMTQNRMRTKKRNALNTPQKGQRRKRKPLMSTPKKLF